VHKEYLKQKNLPISLKSERRYKGAHRSHLLCKVGQKKKEVFLPLPEVKGNGRKLLTANETFLFLKSG